MFFGATSFAAAPFADQGFNPNAFVDVTGSRINESTGTVSLVGKANFAVTGSRVNFSIGNTSVIEGVGVIVTPDGSRLNITTGDPAVDGNAIFAITGSRVNVSTSDVLIRKWDGVVPGVSMTWDSATFPEKRV